MTLRNSLLSLFIVLPLLAPSVSYAQEQAAQSTPSSAVIQSTKYGDSRIMPFEGAWLADFPSVLSHIETEHVLHVKGLDDNKVGLTWDASKFIATGMNPALNPEATVATENDMGIQLKLGYFKIPLENLKVMDTKSLSKAIREQVIVKEHGRTFFVFFVHPEAYSHYESLFDAPGVVWITPNKSEFLGSPTSSYRSWVVRKIKNSGIHGANYQPAPKSIPFVVKLGVAGSVLGSDRWLSKNEIIRSIVVQRLIDELPADQLLGDNFKLWVFPETLGVFINDSLKAHYNPADSQDKDGKISGIIIREFPQDMLTNKIHVLSYASVMSVERLKYPGVGSPNPNGPYRRLPLIYELIASYKNSTSLKDSLNYILEVFVNNYLSSIEQLTFVNGLTVEPHSQNLNLVVDRNLTPLGVAIRDHGGVWIDITARIANKLPNDTLFELEADDVNLKTVFKMEGSVATNYLTSFSWFYRYQVLQKTLNVLIMPTNLDQDPQYIDVVGAPQQIGHKDPLKERLLVPYLWKHTNSEEHKLISYMGLPLEMNDKMITYADDLYKGYLARYFKLERNTCDIFNSILPSAEGGSERWAETLKPASKFFGSNRNLFLWGEKPISEFKELKDLDSNRMIVSTLDDFNPAKDAKYFIAARSGSWFLDDRHVPRGFLFYSVKKRK